MSISIQSVNLKDNEKIDSRTVMLNQFVQSLNINQIDGSFVVTEPMKDDGRITIYPQSPNNILYPSKSYQEFIGFGTLNLPLDAKFDYIRRKIWIADAGNRRTLKVNIDNDNVEMSINDVTLPHSVVPEMNNGGVFIKAFSGVNTGVVYYYKYSGELDDYFTFPCDLGYATTDVERTELFVKSLPLSSTMVYDHVRWRLWWTSGTYIYMMDVRNRQVAHMDISTSYTETRGLDIEFSTGNAFVVSKHFDTTWKILQIFRDNNKIMC